MKKILIDARSLGNKPSGIGIYIYHMAKALHKEEDYEIALVSDVASSDEIKELNNSGIKLYVYGKSLDKNIGLYLYYKYVQKCIDEYKPDIFWEGNNLVPITIKNPYGKLVASIQDVFPVSHPRYYGKFYSHYFKMGMNRTIKTFDTFIYDSYNTKEEAEKYFPILKDKDTHVGYIIVPRLPELEIKDNNSFFYVGNLEKRKGTDILLKAYKQYKERGGDKGLRLSGKIRDLEIQELLEEITYEVDGILYLGYLSEKERNKEFASCSCFVFPSRLEGFGIPVVEAMNYYKPIIASNLNTIKEIVGDNVKYIAIKGKPIDNLTEAMLEKTKRVDQDKYNKVLDKYSEESIIKVFKEIFEK